MLPQVAIGRHCCAQSTNPNNYRPLVGDDLIDELIRLAKSLGGSAYLSDQYDRGGWRSR